MSVPTSKLLSEVGFDVFLYDNREDINTFDDNTYVLQKTTIDYTDILNSISFSKHDYVLLMTHKFVEDKLILSQLIDKSLHYLGVLGSDNKIKVMFDALLKEGITQQQLDKVHAPIGLSIYSKTTEEIAISIVAEVIQCKNI